MTHLLRTAIVTLFVFAAPLTLAADPAAGKAKSMTCAACHGTNGISPNDMWPNLAGQKNGYLVSQLRMFRDGERVNPLMTPMSTGLSDSDIADLAAYYSSLK
jgi:cytochrome c553